MGKSTYSVPIVERRLLPLWHEFWDQDPPSERAIKANADGSLQRTAFPISTNNMRVAADIAEKQNPGCVAIRSAIQRHR